MIDWRTLLRAPTYPQYPHNEQKGKARGSFADIAGIAHSEATEKTPPLQPGWRELAQLTAGLERDDPRLNPVLDMMIEGAKSQDAGDALGFEKATERVQRLMQFAPGALVRWQGSEEHQLKVLGPATVEFVHVADNQLWVWTTWKGQGRWVPESVMTTIERPRQNHLE